jgi:hypothetical protein
VLLQSIPFINRELFDIKDPGQERAKANLKRFLGLAQQPHFKNELMAGRATFLEKIEPLIATTGQGYLPYPPAQLSLPRSPPGMALASSKSPSAT